MERVEDRAIADACPTPIFVIQDATLRYVNLAFAALVGRDRDALIGGNAIDTIHPDDRAHLVERGPVAPGGPGGVVRIQFRIRRHDGGHTWVYATTSPYMYDGRPAVLGTAIEVHERRHAQEAVAKAQRLEVVARLAGGVAHDYNNLLQIVLGHAERLLQAMPEGEPLRESAIQIQRGAERAAVLTDRLLSLGQRQLLDLEPMDLGQVLAGIREALQGRIGDGIRLTIRPSQRSATVRADRSRLMHVLVHLVDNAREAMPDGGTLTIGAEYVDIDDAMRTDRPWLRSGPYMRLVVEDSGPGMEPGAAAHAFEPFFTTKPRGSGIGLGLATVYGLVKQSRGFVWIESSPGAGTRAVVLLPADGMAPAEAGAGVVRQAGSLTETEAPCVLLVEDEPSVRDVLSIALSRHGFRVIAAPTAEEALPVPRDSFDVVLTDVSLPGISGVQLAQRIRGTHPHLPVLLMSGYAREEFLTRSSDENELPFIEKPFTTRAIVERLRGLLERGPLEEATPS